jgi:hypothetical protein
LHKAKITIVTLCRRHYKPQSLKIMNKKNTLIKSLTLLIALFGAVNFGYGQCTGITVTWTAGAWSNGTGPTIDDEVIIDTDYNTGVQVSFSACSLLVRNGATLTITDETYVEIENDATVDGVGSEILVETFGAFVQRGSSNTAFNLTNGGTAILNKTTREYSNIPGLNYVYWSSPVASADLETIFPNPYLNRRYYFDATLFLDEFTVGASGPPATSGIPDGIDDNGNDWQTVSGTMEIGRGYVIATENSAPYIDNHDFTGEFNTGDITVPVFRNVFPDDENSNLIGNPYPCAIDAYRFIFENYYDLDQNPSGTITGAIYTWTSNTLPNDTTDGNYTFNFSQDDYTAINLVGSAGIGPPPPPGVVADPIFSGQGFFVSYHNDGVSTSSVGDIDEGEVYFNNDMRVSQGILAFNPFKVSNTKNEIVNSNPNKLWVNLTSDNGVFNQVLIGYLNRATNNYDGDAFDAPKGLLSLGAPSILYTTIPDDSDKKFIIQGKAESSLNQDEVINLGFDTKIDVPTIYTLSIAQLQGAFLTNNPIYLKDNVANTIHDLSDSDYSFTSEVGEFKDRFEIVFTNQALSNDTFDVALNTLQIKQVNDTQVRFSTSNSLTIKEVAIYDLLGRQLYNLEGNNSVETYNLSNLNNSVFIAKVALSNGAIVTKKAIKK